MKSSNLKDIVSVPKPEEKKIEWATKINYTFDRYLPQMMLFLKMIVPLSLYFLKTPEKQRLIDTY